jgi:hypothetical protein
MNDAAGKKKANTVAFERNADRVVRRSTGTRGTREAASRAYEVYRFGSATAANAIASVLTKKASPDAGSGALLREAARVTRDGSTFLHVSEAAQALAAAQLRELGSRPSGRFVADALEAWDGRGYIAVGDCVVALPSSRLPQTVRAMERTGRRAVESVPAELVDTAHAAHCAAVEAREARNRLRSPVEVKTLPAGDAS